MSGALISLEKPRCYGMEELPSADTERARVLNLLQQVQKNLADTDPAVAPDAPSSDPLFTHLSHGLAYTIGSALGSIPPTTEACLAAFTIPNIAGLSAGARAWSKHFHRSIPAPVAQPNIPSTAPEDCSDMPSMPTAITDCIDGSTATGTSTSKKKSRPKKQPPPTGWWGSPSGPVPTINAKALELFWRIMNNATWRNLHWLPHRVLVYEARVVEGYGMRWSQDRSGVDAEVDGGVGTEAVPRDQAKDEEERIGQITIRKEDPPWVFRGFVEPMMENGHEQGWRH